MKKTITITLNKLIFYIEEEAYQILKEYLDSIMNRFKSPDGEEILADMEASIAEKFNDKIAKKEVITKEEVLELIKVMGSVEDIEDESESNFSSKKEEEKKISDIPKKLYRNPDDVIIAGVCSGLAAFFGIDPTIVRLIFVISIFFGGTGVFAYIILWLIVPEAKSNSQKLEMKGDAVTLKKIEENVREKINKFEEENPGFFKKIISKLSKVLEAIFSLFGVLFKNFFKILGFIVGVSLFIAAIATIFGATFGAGVLIFNMNTLSTATDFPIMGAISPAMYYFLVTALFIIIIIPFIFLSYLGLLLIRRKNFLKALTSSVLVGVWMLAIIVSGIVLIDTYPRVRRMIDDYNSSQEAQMNSKSYDFKDFSDVKLSGVFETEIKYGKDYQVFAKGRQQDLDKIKIDLIDKKLEIKEEWSKGICFFCYLHPVKFEITLPEIKNLELSGATKTNISKFDFEDLNLNVSGASKLSMKEIKANNIFLDFDGASNIDLSGETKRIEIKGKGASKISTLGLVSDIVDVTMSGASKAIIGNSKSLKVDLSGASNVNYLGNPKVISNISGASNIEKINIGQ